jgi:amidohydrolase
MIEDGCLTGTTIGQPVEHMFGLHGWPQLDLGLVATRVGPLLAAADMFNLTITGTGGHAAFPHLVRDPVVAGSAIVTALQHLVSRNIDPVDSAVISTTQFHAGTTYNIIENIATLNGTVRTLREETRQMLKQRMPEVINGIASAYGCTAEFEYVEGYPPTVNHEEAVALFNGIAIGADRVLDVPAPFMGAEDFSFYGQQVPACFFILGLNPVGGAMPGLHQPTFDFNDEAIPLGIELFCRLALRE